MGSLLGYPRDFLVASLTTEKSANMDNSLLKVCKIATRGDEVRCVGTFAIALQSIMTYTTRPKICLKELIGKLVENAFPKNV